MTLSTLWHMGLFALLLHKELGFKVDLGRVLTLILVHDLVEIHAGDTYAYDDAGCARQAEREIAAAERLFSLNFLLTLVLIFMSGSGGTRGGRNAGSPPCQGRGPAARLARIIIQGVGRGVRTEFPASGPISAHPCRWRWTQL